jgi:hypothetical protein
MARKEEWTISAFSIQNLYYTVIRCKALGYLLLKHLSCTNWFLPFQMACVYDHITEINFDVHVVGLGCLLGTFKASLAICHFLLILPRRN